MCSIEALGQSREMYPEAPEYGIYIFSDDAVVGESAIHALGLDDVVFEYEITSNRVDCYSVIGIAREAAATSVSYTHLRSHPGRGGHPGKCGSCAFEVCGGAELAAA